MTERAHDYPVKPANRAEYDMFTYLYAALKTMRCAEEPLRKRLGLIPGGWRKMRAASGLLDHLLLDLKYTFDDKKWAQIERTIRRLDIRFVIGPQASQEEETYVFGAHDLAVLMRAAAEKCTLCMGTPAECRRCELGKSLDATSFISRQGRAWWEVFERTGRVEDVGKDPGYLED